MKCTKMKKARAKLLFLINLINLRNGKADYAFLKDLKADCFSLLNIQICGVPVTFVV